MSPSVSPSVSPPVSPQVSAAQTLTDALSQPWLKVPWSHPPSHGPIQGEQGLPIWAIIPHPLHCKPGSEEGHAVVDCVMTISPVVFISAFWPEVRIQNIPAPARRWSHSDLGGIHIPAFCIALPWWSTPFPSLPTLGSGAEAPHPSLSFSFAPC